MPEEGVSKFVLHYTHMPAGSVDLPEALNQWRSRLWQHRLIGYLAASGGGIGYGNVSRRIQTGLSGAGFRGFIISGTQTGALAMLDASQYCLVTDWDAEQNRVTAQGPVRPSSEALTHGMLYDLDADINVVFHVHSATIWQAARRLGLATTKPAVAYGTPEMASEVARLYRNADFTRQTVFAMGGHRDGIVAFGPDEETAGRALLETLEHSQRL
ncbi:MAG: class II aldolase/adducin family protein [Pseudomonadota bacterium]